MKIKYISWIPAVLMMIIIFCFSSKPADASNESSLMIVHQIINIYDNVTNAQLQADEKVELENTLNHIVRKSAHFCEYALLSITIIFHLAIIKLREKWQFLIPVIICFLYASTDEYHQTFVPGRAGLFKDVLLDTSGAVTGALLFILFMIMITGKLKRQKAIS